MSQAKIQQALIQAVKDVPGMLPFSTAGIAFTPPASGLPYADVSVIQNEPSVNTLGDEGDDLVEGFMQVLLKYPVDKGTLAPLRLGDTLRESFKAGHRVYYEGQEVFIVRSGIGRFDTVDGRLVNPFTIYFYATIRR